MQGASAKIEKLIAESSAFDFHNFSTKSDYGYPDAYKPDWVAWRARVTGAINSLFGEGSAPAKMVRQGGQVHVLGNGSDKFDLAKSFYDGALSAAAAILEDDTFGEIKGAETNAPLNYSNRIFVVHGRDEKAKQQLEIFLREIGLEPIVLHREANSGRTLIEKFEHYSDVGFAFILMTPDEVAYLSDQENVGDDKREKENRARPNVIFEFGYFVGKLGRHRTCCILHKDVAVPSDLEGLVYKHYDGSIENVAYGLMRELTAAGYKLAVG